MSLIRCSKVFCQGRLSRHIASPSEKTRPDYMCKAEKCKRGFITLSWVRQLRSGSCQHPTAATKCNEQPSQTTETPLVENAHPPRVVYCAIKSTLNRFTKFRVSNLHITCTPDAANTLHQSILSREAIPTHNVLIS